MSLESRRLKVSARIENLEDVLGLTRGAIEPAQVRSLTVDGAMVDPMLHGLIIPSRLMGRLGLRPTTLRQKLTPIGTVLVQMSGAGPLTIREPDRVTEVQEILGDSPSLLARIPFVELDWILDSVGPRLVGSPEHDGQHMAEAF